MFVFKRKGIEEVLSLEFSGWRPFCPKFLRRKCFTFKNCGKRRRFCVCVWRYYGDETENDDQVSDNVAEEEEEAEDSEETSKHLR